MPSDLSEHRQVIISDLKALVTELETNPHASPWVINLALRTVREKVGHWEREIIHQKTHLERIFNLDPESCTPEK